MKKPGIGSGIYLINSKKQLSINLIASMVSFAINIGISFFLTPYITRTIGVEAYGFISLGGNFVNYASLATIALNSMAARFISIEIHKNNWDGANKYFNSVLISNVLIASVMIVPAIICVVFINRIVNVPIEILSDVRILFSFLFANFLISIIVSLFGVSTFVTNRLYLKSMRTIESSTIKVIALIVLFSVLKPAVSYVGFAAFIVVLYTALFNIYYTRKYLPEIKISKKHFEKKAITDLLSSGIWNTIIKAGQILLEGVDLLIANLFINPTAMGTLALAKTVPLVIGSFTTTVSGVFVPDFTALYAKGQIDELVTVLKRSMKILGILLNIPIAVIAVFGREFFTLWVPGQDPVQLQLLSMIILSLNVISTPINSIFHIFTVTNKLKVNAIILLFTGVLNLSIVFILLKFTDLGVIAIAGVSSALGILRNLAFTVPFGAKYLGLKWNTFYPEVIKTVIGFIIISAIGIAIRSMHTIDGWINLIIAAAATGVLGLIVNSIIILNKQERQRFILLIKSKISKR